MNITDRLYTEWAWRTKTGIPDINNPEDKSILDNLIKELITEQEQITSKQDLINLIQNTELSETQIARIKKSIVNIGYKDDILQILANKGFTQDAFRSKGALDGIFQALAEVDLEMLFKYLENPKKLAAPKGNIVELTGLDSDTVNKIFSIEPGLDAGGSSIGPGEIGLALLFSDIDNRGGGGDLNWGGSNLEVKKTGGRLGQQGGRASNINTFDYLVSSIEGLSEEAKNYLYNNVDTGNIPHSLKGLYQIAKKQGIKDNVVFDAIAKVVDQIYYEKGYTRNYFNSPKDFDDLAQAKRNLIKINLHSYMDKNSIGAMLFWNPQSTNYLTFRKEDVDRIVDARAIDTSKSASPKDATLGYRWNNPYPSLFFI